MKRAALFVGVNRYEDPEITSLEYAENDATELYAFFKHRAGYDDVRHLLSPDSDKILDTASDMLQRLGPEDLFLFFFAGHGVEHGGRHLLLCPKVRYSRLKYHPDAVPLDLLKQETSMGGVNRILILDACRTDLLKGRRSLGQGMRDVQCLRTMVAQSSPSQGSLAILCSCDEGQQAQELHQLGQGLFTQVLLDMFESSERGRLSLSLGDEFEERLVAGMRNLARNAGMGATQRPWIQKSGTVPAILSWPSVAGSPIRHQPQQDAARDSVPDRRQRVGTVAEQPEAPIAVASERIIRTDAASCAAHYCCDETQLKRVLRERAVSSLKEWNDAADDGNPEALWLLALCHEYGYSVARDPVKAARLHRKAAKQAYSWAQLSMGKCYEVGAGVSQNVSLAVEWIQKAAEQGNAVAQRVLGGYYSNGFGVAKDLEAAAEWFERAGEQGDPEAQNLTGVYYSDGKGVAQNYVSAVSWFRKAAEQGFVWGQYNLASCLYAGNGCEVDLTQAVVWYQKAAEQGNADAQKKLAEIRQQHLITPGKTAKPNAIPTGSFSSEQILRNLKGVPENERARINLKRLNPGSEEASQQQISLAESLKVPVEVENSIGMKFRLIPAGKFNMGAENDHESNRPVHEVTLSQPFWIGRFPVTQAEWFKVMGEKPSKSKRVFWDAGPLDLHFGISALIFGAWYMLSPETFTLEDGGLIIVIYAIIAILVLIVNLFEWIARKPRFLPVDSVSWDDAQRFLDKLCAMENVPAGTYRLPTEAEWEYACRAGTVAEYYGNVVEVVVHKDNSPSFTNRIGTRLPNAWGVSDMLGNINEWCMDLWSGYRAGSITDPCVNAGADPCRCVRGGALGYGAKHCRAATRYAEKPDFSDKWHGFRVVRVIT